MKTHYDVLGVPPNADPETVKAAYRKILKAFHPDLHGGGDVAEIRSRQIITAYAVLKDADERARYDEQLRRRRGRLRLFVIVALVSAGLVGTSSLFFLNLLLKPAMPEFAARIPASPAETRILADAAPAEGATASPVAVPARPMLEQTVPQPEPARRTASPVAVPAKPLPEQTAPQPEPARRQAPPHETAWLAIENHNVDALWVFIQQYPGTPQAELAAKRLEPLIEAIDDAASLKALAARATGSIADRVAARLAQLTAAKDDATAALPEPAGNAAQSEAAPPADAGPEDAQGPELEPAASALGDGDARLASSDPLAAVRQALSLMSTGESDMAMPFSRDSGPLAHGNAKYYVHRADFWAGRGDLDRALQDFDAAIMVDGVNIDAFHGRGLLRLRRGEVELALADLDRAIRLSFADPKIYIDRGLIWYQRGGYDRAIADFNQAIKLAPHLAKAYFYRGRALRRKHEFKSAIADLDQAIQLNPELAEAHRNLDLARAQKDDPADAASELAR